MVKRNVAHNAKTLMLPISFGSRMVSSYEFEPDAHHPDRIWTKLKPNPKSHTESMDRYRWLDPFEARTQFLKARNAQEILGFLNSLGVSWSQETTPAVTGDGESWIGMRQAQPIFEKDICTFQEFTRRALASPYSRWLRLSGGGYLYAEAVSSLRTLCKEENGMLALEFVPTTLSEAILGTVIADKLAKNRYRLCALAECRTPFKAGRRQPPKRFCIPAHRAVAAMRRYRRCSKYRGRQSARKSKEGGKPI